METNDKCIFEGCSDPINRELSDYWCTRHCEERHKIIDQILKEMSIRDKWAIPYDGN